jgi:hypothetical protein
MKFSPPSLPELRATKPYFKHLFYLYLSYFSNKEVQIVTMPIPTLHINNHNICSQLMETRDV